MNDNLSQLKICVEKHLEGSSIKQLKEQSNSPHHFEKLKAAFWTRKLWPKDSIISISFVEPRTDVKWTSLAILESKRDSQGKLVGLDPIEKHIRGLSPVEAVKKVISERIQPLVGIKFTFVPHGKGNVRIGFNPQGGSNALVGTDNRDDTNSLTTVNYGWLDTATIIHEMCHVLGMIHEHQNPRGNTIDWDTEKVYKWANDTYGWNKQKTYHNIIEAYKVDQINGSEFDPKSIMLYFFPGSITKNGKGTHMNHRLSLTDAQWLYKMYPGGLMTPDEYMGIYPDNKKINWTLIIIVVSGLILLIVIIYNLFRRKKIVHNFYKRSVPRYII